MELTGEHFIGARRVAAGAPFNGIAAATGEPTSPAYGSAGPEHVDAACGLATQAFSTFAHSDPEARAAFLETVAANIEALGDALIERAHLESGLPVARLTGERGRTCGQLRLFAAEVRDGGWQDIRIDPAMPDRQPLPRPDLRLRKVAIGPVAVFGASNFPLAFSVAGGDTASALAAGCPVVVKGHAAHPGTSEMVASAIAAAVASSGLPEGVFSMLVGNTNDLGAALVADPRIKAVGFTGSRGGGLALMAIAAGRPEPIPVYAEMSAVNPVILMPGALADRAEALGAAYVGSLTLGAGQFCTNPGLVLAIDGPDLARFTAAAVEAMGKAAAQTMLTPGIHAAYAKGVETLGSHAGVETLARGLTGDAPAQGQAALFATSADVLERDNTVSEEVFGAASVLVRCADSGALARAIANLEGQLTATVHFAASDEPAVAELLPLIETKAGRILANGWPTGVEVSHAMVHGGPFPATSDGRSTSVGTLAIDRFVRPVCYQDFPDSLLPAPLRDSALAGVRHRHDGKHRV